MGLSRTCGNVAIVSIIPRYTTYSVLQSSRVDRLPRIKKRCMEKKKLLFCWCYQFLMRSDFTFTFCNHIKKRTQVAYTYDGTLISSAIFNIILIILTMSLMLADQIIWLSWPGYVNLSILKIPIWSYICRSISIAILE